MKRLLLYILKISLGVLAGYALWTILMMSLEPLLDFVMPDWYSAEGNSLSDAMNRKNPSYAPTRGFLLIGLLQNIFSTMAAGWVSVFVSKKRFVPPYLIGLTVAVFLFVGQYYTTVDFPLWYKFFLVGTAIPVSLIGGRFAR